MAKALKGFRRIKVFPVTKNDATGYTNGAAVAITGAQSLTFSPETSESKIYADDGVYDSVVNWLGMKFTLTLAECPLSLKKYFEGGSYDQATGVYTFASDDSAPELGMSFVAKQSDGTYMMVKLFSLRCTSYKNDFKTMGEGNEITSVTIEGTIMNRKDDNTVKQEKEAATEADFTWADTLVA